jgi:ketosteroid isomerase-like protein
MPTTMTQDAAVRRGIEETNRRFEEAFTGGDLASAMREVYAADARVLPPDAEVVRGRENIAQFWAGAAKQLGIQRVKLQTVELQPVGDQAYEIGRAMLTLGGGQQAVAKYVVIWKQEGGRWKIEVDVWNMNPA